ncbi:Gmad2 immunoglobulin-like domain-containing protein [Specibacter cremeus]|uniref:Gmad2 immunoglobulin-like domain-containing protein n=1 Tax=Specibacter cremeus TaxID=1629051 RepID=UPI000F78C6A2|nr:Gmad2 immunoglobulin-like domain-containing protein [Specibacter cremeus]
MSAARTPAVRRGRLRRGLGGVVPAAVLVLALGGCMAGGPSSGNGSMPASSGGSASALVTSLPLETAAAAATMPVYWLGHSGDDVFLYREFLKAQPDADPIVAALTAMTSQRPADPDYFTVWRKPSRLGVSISGTNTITVDISADAFAAKVDLGIAERAIAQLVYTATAAASMAGLVDPAANLQVSILVDGHTGFNAFGRVVLDHPLSRENTFVAPIWVVNPPEAAALTVSPVTVSGRAISSTGTLDWQLRAVGGGVVQSGTTAIAAGADKLGDFSFKVTTAPGTYEIRVFTADPSVPGSQVGVDSKTFTLK